jgi:Trehalose utilisation
MNEVLSRRAFLESAALGTGAMLALPAFGETPKKRKLVLLAGSPSHGPGDHEFNAGIHLLAKCLTAVKDLEVTIHNNGWPKDIKAFDGADGILSYCDGGGRHPLILDKHLEVIGGLMKKGVGLMCAHYAVEVPKDLGGREFQEWIGGHYEHMYSCNPMWTPEFREFPKHPITRGVKPFAVRDEWYFNMRFRPEMQGITPILSAKPSDEVRKGPYVYPKGPYDHIVQAAGRAEAMMWAVERPDGGRGVGFTGGHFHRNWANDDFRKVVLNALLWICKMEVPEGGVASKVTEAEMAENLDPKGKKK